MTQYAEFFILYIVYSSFKNVKAETADTYQVSAVSVIYFFNVIPASLFLLQNRFHLQNQFRHQR